MRWLTAQVGRSVAVRVVGVQSGIHLEQIGMDQRLAFAKVLNGRHQLIVGGIVRPRTKRGGSQN